MNLGTLTGTGGTVTLAFLTGVSASMENRPSRHSVQSFLSVASRPLEDQRLPNNFAHSFLSGAFLLQVLIPIYFRSSVTYLSLVVSAFLRSLFHLPLLFIIASALNLYKPPNPQNCNYTINLWVSEQRISVIPDYHFSILRPQILLNIFLPPVAIFVLPSITNTRFQLHIIPQT